MFAHLFGWWKRRIARQKNDLTFPIQAGDTVRLTIWMEEKKRKREVIGEVVWVGGGYANVLVVFEDSFLAGRLKRCTSTDAKF